MHINDIVQFLVMAQEHSKPEHLISDLEHLLKGYNAPYYAVISQPKPTPDPYSLVLAGHWPDGWPERYVERRYILVDPTIRYLPHATSGYAWNSTLAYFDNDAQQGKMQKMLTDARRYGLKEGYVFPVHGPKGLTGNMTISADEIELSPVEIALFEQVAKITLLELMKFKAQQQSSGDTEQVEHALPNAVTSRELEIVNYLADGFTSQEVANILEISSHTVDWHINSLQEKFGAKNRQHTVATAFRRGLVI